MSNRKYVGTVGENMASEYLVGKGYRIVERNYRCSNGEIDIIAVNDNICVFVEVKLRKSKSFGEPCEAVTESKQRIICRTAEKYICDNEINSDIRFDVIEIYKGKINHIEDAFWGDV